MECQVVSVIFKRSRTCFCFTQRLERADTKPHPVGETTTTPTVNQDRSSTLDPDPCLIRRWIDADRPDRPSPSISCPIRLHHLSRSPHTVLRRLDRAGEASYRRATPRCEASVIRRSRVTVSPSDATIPFWWPPPSRRSRLRGGASTFVIATYRKW